VVRFSPLSAATFKPLVRPRRRFADMEHAIGTSVLGLTARAANPMLSLMRFKTWADAELLSRVLALPEFLSSPTGQLIPIIVRHFHTVDCIFKAHLLGVPHGYTSANPSEPSTLSELELGVRAIDEWYVEYAQNVGQRDLAQALNVKFTDGAEQVMSRTDILLHVSLHGAAHRAQAAVLMQQYGAEPPPDRFSSYLSRR
jgi:uncharacterized damage-inducible protein DinB